MLFELLTILFDCLFEILFDELLGFRCLWVIANLGPKLKSVSQQCFRLLMLSPAVESSAYAAMLTLSLGNVVTIFKTIKDNDTTSMAHITMAIGSHCVVPST